MRPHQAILFWFQAFAARSALGFAARVPEGPAYALAEQAGNLLWLVSSRHRRLALENLTLALGPGAPGLRDIARSSCATITKAALDFARIPRLLAQRRLLERVDLSEAGELLDRARAGPAILLTPHLGGWEAGGVAMALTCPPIHVVARRVTNPFLERGLLAGRERAGLVVHTRKGAVRFLAKALASGSRLALLPDQNQRKRGVFVPFFGRLASTGRTPAALAIRHRVPILPAVVVRQGRGFRFRLLPGEPILPTAPEVQDGDVVGLTLRITRVLEPLIRTWPEQYLWIHDRYKTRPPEEAAAGSATERGQAT